MNRRVISLFLLLCVFTIFSGCAYLESTTPKIQEAEKALGEALIKGANEKAPYEYTSAVHFLDMAKEERDENDSRAAIEFANTALERANKAIELSK